MRRLSPDASSSMPVGRSEERCERNVHSTYFHTKPSVSECSHGPRYRLRPLFHLYITHISQSHDPRNRLPQGSDRANNSSLRCFRSSSSKVQGDQTECALVQYIHYSIRHRISHNGRNGWTSTRTHDKWTARCALRSRTHLTGHSSQVINTALPRRVHTFS